MPLLTRKLHKFAISCFTIVLLVVSAETNRAKSVRANELSTVDHIDVLDLDTAISIALAGNPTIDAAKARVLQAKARLNQSRSTYWPRVDGAVSGSRISLSERTFEERLAQARFFNPTIEIKDPETYYRARLSAVWVLFDGFERKFKNASALTGLAQSETARLETRRLLLTSVARTYFAAQLALENLAIARADATFNQRLLTEAQARRRSGTGSLSDELNFQVRVNAALGEEIKAQEAYASTKFALAAILGIPTARFPAKLTLARLARASEQDMQPQTQQPLIEYALNHRPDLRQSEFELTQAELAVKIARSGYYPKINFLAAMDGERPQDTGLEEDDFGKTLGVELSYNLFSGGLTRAGIDEAKARMAEKTKQLANTRIQINAEVLSALSNLTAAQRQLSLQRDNAELVKRQRILVEKEYQAGQGTLVRLNEAQRDLTATQGRLALALASVHDAWFKLNTETGKVLEAYPLLSPE